MAGMKKRHSCIIKILAGWIYTISFGIQKFNCYPVISFRNVRTLIGTLCERHQLTQKFLLHVIMLDHFFRLGVWKIPYGILYIHMNLHHFNHRNWKSKWNLDLRISTNSLLKEFNSWSIQWFLIFELWQQYNWLISPFEEFPDNGEFSFQ